MNTRFAINQAKAELSQNSHASLHASLCRKGPRRYHLVLFALQTKPVGTSYRPVQRSPCAPAAGVAGARIKNAPMNRKALILWLTGTALMWAGPASAGSILQADTVAVQTFQCDEPAAVCLDLPLSTLSHLLIYSDGLPYNGPIEGCQYDTLVTYTYNTLFGQGSMGPYQLESWEVNGITYSAQFDDIDQLVALMNMWDPAGNWTHDPSMLMIAGGAPNTTYSDMVIKALSNNTLAIVGMNFGLDAQGTSLQFSTGVHQVIFFDTEQSLLDTVVVIVECLPLPQTSTVYDTIIANSGPSVFCIDTTDLPGKVVSIANACPDASGTFVSFHISTTDYCVKYQGLKCGGSDSACIVVCDDMGYCDTTYLFVTVDETVCSMESAKITDTLIVNFDGSWCLDTTELPGTIVAIENVCPDQSGTNVDFELTGGTWCVTGMSISPGTDTACVVLRDEFGNTDTTFLCITVITPPSECIYDTVQVGQTRTWCPDLSQLAGMPLSIEDACSSANGSQVLFEIDPASYCLTGKGLTPGTDTACIVICDAYGVCDTTCLVITTISSSPCSAQDAPIAEDDLANTSKDTPVWIDVLANDFVSSCAPPVLYVLDPASGGSGPTYGTAIVDNQNLIEYTPEAGYCGTDALDYVLCNAAGCDTATVFITIDCSTGPLLVFNGFSPNGDGTNDTFVIQNLDQYPDNRLVIYNRWGEMVFQAQNYQNDWDGSWNGKKVPDGTYFYLLEVDTNETTVERLSGYLQIRR